jgi:hypothetical protein
MLPVRDAFEWGQCFGAFLALDGCWRMHMVICLSDGEFQKRERSCDMTG